MFLDIFVFMKIIITFAFFFSIINYCPAFAQKFNCQYECQGIKDGSIELVVWSTKKSNKYTLQQAQKDALMAVIKTSISSKNCQNQPPLIKEEEAISSFKSIQKKFFSKNGDWKMFVSNSEELTSNLNQSENQPKKYKVLVLKSELRKYLESKNVTKPLNNGF
jgi:hypothetical protein